jgi:hypothetical protein
MFEKRKVEKWRTVSAWTLVVGIDKRSIGVGDTMAFLTKANEDKHSRKHH